MKFWKKNKGKAKGSRHELRRFYRRAPEKKHALSVQIRREEATPLNGELVDVSAGGAGILFRKGNDPQLEEGVGTILVFSSLVRGGQILATSRVASATPTEAGTRYGFEFIDLPGLFDQLDDYYIRFFNRRRSLRVRPGLDQKIETRLSAPAGAIIGRLNDFSVDGAGMVVDPAKAEIFTGAEKLEVQFVIPKSRVEVRWRARAVHMTPAKSGVIMGGEFTPAESPELDGQRRALAEYAAARAAEMARWNSAYD